MIGGQGLYSQTPGAFHMYGGAPNLAGYSDPAFGNPFGPVGRGDALASALGQTPQHLLTLGGVLSLTQGLSGNRMNLLGRATTPLANMLGFHGLGMVGGIGAHLIAGQAASSFAAGIGQQQDAQRALNQVFGGRDLGGFMGFGASREDANQLAGIMRDMTRSTDLLTSDQEVKNLFQKFNKMKLMQTSRDAKDMMGRFKELVTTVRDISRDLGTTMEGVMPFFEQQVRMGFNDPQEIRRQLRINRAMRDVGIGIDDEQLIALQQSSAAANRAVGGSGRFGAEAVRRNLGMLSTAVEQGMISDQQLIDITGRRGSEGVAELAQQMTMASRRLMQSTGQGRMLAGVLGQTDEEGRFTGQIDMGALERLRGMSMEQLQREFDRKTSSRKAQISFEAQMEMGMGANFTAELGGDFNKILDLIFKEEGETSRDAQQLILRQLVPGMRADAARAILDVYQSGEKLNEIAERKSREAMLRNRIPSVIEEQFSVSSRLARASRTLGQALLSPIESSGSRFGQAFGEYSDDVAEAFMTGGLMPGLGEIFASPFRESRLRDTAISDIINNRLTVDPALRTAEQLTEADRLRNLGENITKGISSEGDELTGLFGRFTDIRGLRGGETRAAQKLIAASQRVFDKQLTPEQVNALAEAINRSGGDVIRFGDDRAFTSYGALGAGGLSMLRRAMQDNAFEGRKITAERASQIIENAERMVSRSQLEEVETVSEAQSGIESMFDADSTFGGFFDESQFGGGILSIEDDNLRGYAHTGKHDKISRILELANSGGVFGRQLADLNPTEKDARELMRIYGNTQLKGMSEEDVLSLLRITTGMRSGEGSRKDLQRFTQTFERRRRTTLNQLFRMRRNALLTVEGAESLKENASAAVQDFVQGGDIGSIIGLEAGDVDPSSRLGSALMQAASVDTLTPEILEDKMKDIGLKTEGLTQEDRQRQLATYYVTSAAPSVSEARTTSSLERFQGVARTAQLVEDVSKEIAGMLENTQKSSAKFQASSVRATEVIEGSIRRLNERLPE